MVGHVIAKQIATGKRQGLTPGLCDGAAWKVHVGAEQQRLWCENCLVAMVQGDIGYGKQWTPNVFAAAYVGGAVQNERNGQGWGFARVSADLIVNLNEHLNSKIGVEQRFNVKSGLGSYAV